MAGTIRVAVCDDARAVKIFLSSVLEEEGDMQVVSATSSGREALQDLERHQPHVLLLDLLLPDVPVPADLVRRVRELSPETAIVLISNMPPFRLRDEAQRLGTEGWVTKAHKPQQLREAVRQAAPAT